MGIGSHDLGSSDPQIMYAVSVDVANNYLQYLYNHLLLTSESVIRQWILACGENPKKDSQVDGKGASNS